MCFRSQFLLFMGIVCICTATDYPTLRIRDVQFRNNRSLHDSQTPLKDMMSQINDRVSALATLDQAQRNKLDDIEKKLIQMDSTNNMRLESIYTYQRELSKQLESIQHVQHNVLLSMGDIRNKLEQLNNVEEDQDTAQSHVHVRQAVNAGDVSEADELPVKLDSLATFMASTRLAVNRIESTLNEYGDNLLKLTALIRAINTRKRTSNLPSKQQFYNGAPQPQHQQQYPQIFSSYGAPPSLPSSCADALLSDVGLQKIQLDPHNEPFYALCESADQGGWTVIQNRVDGTINFNRGWEEYKTGFGNLAGEFFIGLEKLHAITATALQELMIVLVDFKNETRTAKYDAFAISGEKEFYALHILGAYSGTAGDSFSFQAGNKFSTFDNDNDGWVEGNCAQAHTGAWWYGACEMSNLNGQYLSGDVDTSQQYQGMYWNEFHGPLYSLKSVQIKIRPIVPMDPL